MPKFTPEHWRTVEAVFLAAGFHFARQEGSHRSYVKPGVARPIKLPAESLIQGQFVLVRRCNPSWSKPLL